MPSLNTIGYQVVIDHLQSCFKLDTEKFYNQLSEHAVLRHKSKDVDDKAIGPDEVMKLYKEKFFDVTSNFDIQEVIIRPNGLNPEFSCRVAEDKTEGNKKYRAEYNHHSVLHIVFEKGKWRIAELINDVTKKILSDESKQPTMNPIIIAFNACKTRIWTLVGA